MAYKIIKGKGTVGPWKEGDVITDADLKANPGMGGLKRLRDELGVIEDTADTGTPSDPGKIVADSDSPGRSAANVSGHTRPGATTSASGEGGETPGDDSPNSRRRR